MLNSLAGYFFWMSLLIPVLVFVVNPLSIVIASAFTSLRKKPREKGVACTPSISMLIVAHKPGQWLTRKLQNCVELEYPSHLLEIIVILDGADAKAVDICNKFNGLLPNKMRFLYSEFGLQRGKISCLNDAILMSRNEILLFSDVDAMIVPDALKSLVKYFDNPRVGGVAGCKKVAREQLSISNPQQIYWRLDAWLKRQESDLGAVTSNDGKIYALRRKLSSVLPTTVTDDLYNCLAILRQGYDFCYEPHAIAIVPTPSRSERHEIARRRRIVCRSLHCLWLLRELLNPLRYGWLAIRLTTNKVLRRFLPVAFVLLLLSSFVLSFANLMYLVFFAVLFFGISIACAYPLLNHKGVAPAGIVKISEIAWYILFGLYGTALGLVDFFAGKRISAWSPVKS